MRSGITFCAMRCRPSSATSPTTSGGGSAAVLEHHYAIIDETVGRAMAALGPDDLLLVVSGYGMEPLGSRQAADRAN